MSTGAAWNSEFERDFFSPMIARVIDLINHQPAHGGQPAMKIHLVKNLDAGRGDVSTFLVKAHTKASAERFVHEKYKPNIEAHVPSQQELIDALKAGIQIEDATNSPQVSIPEPNQQEQE